MTNLRDVNLASAAVKEIKGLSAAGANLQELQLSKTHVSSLDVSNNPNLTSIDLYGVKEMTALDVTHNPKLTSLRIPFTSISSLDVSNNTKLTYLSVSHCKLSTLDIRHILEQVKPFLESANDKSATVEETNSWVKVVVAP